MPDDQKELRRRNTYVRERLKELKAEQEKLKGELAVLRGKLAPGPGQKGAPKKGA